MNGEISAHEQTYLCEKRQSNDPFLLESWVTGPDDKAKEPRRKSTVRDLVDSWRPPPGDRAEKSKNISDHIETTLSDSEEAAVTSAILLGKSKA